MEITQDEYMSIRSVIAEKPVPPNGFDYRLREDLTWELFELPVIAEEDDPELTAEEALDIIVGGATDA